MPWGLNRQTPNTMTGDAPLAGMPLRNVLYPSGKNRQRLSGRPGALPGGDFAPCVQRPGHVPKRVLVSPLS